MLYRNGILAASVLLGAANAHMFISSPTPIEGSAPKDPLDGSGSNFPCHGITLPTSGGQTMAAGSNQTLAFELGGGANTATHGGGSCQISITYETDPAKQKLPSSWKVIYSIEGGCPTDASGNLDTGAGAVACDGTNSPNCVNSFPFTIPKGVKNGHAIMAWTWMNTIGNRELYMNCVNTQFTGGSGSEMDSFPDMFVANLASVNTCPTTEQVNVKFANPGKYVTTHTAGNPHPLAVPTGAGCPSAGAPSYDTGNSLAQQPADSSSEVATTTTVAASSSLSSSTKPPAPSSTSPFSSTTAPTSSAAPSAPSSGNCMPGTVSCSTPGALICIDSTHFGLCDVDFCAIPQPVAAGTVCKNGTIVRSRKRGLRSSRIFGRRV